MGRRPQRVEEVDLRVGREIARLRRKAGMRQLDLAVHLNVSVQLVRKYECGRIRVGSSRLAAIASVLDVPIAALVDHDGWKYESVASRELAELSAFLATNEGTALNMAFQRIKSVQVRRSLLALVRAYSQSF
ncbi:helix-turn-helix domain-containing protein [Ensifer adhaerens]|uniref:helix-turn-helix domain-containing protein n=1 Tax=Ensifer adhaerens TaxID=106592 RepID=UPI00098EECB6|nr:helix-turn-helix transcriptional regulator [Ensifer adhaerens]